MEGSENVTSTGNISMTVQSSPGENGEREEHTDTTVHYLRPRSLPRQHPPNDLVHEDTDTYHAYEEIRSPPYENGPLHML